VGTPAWPDVLAAYARAASDPLKRPAIAAPVITAFDGLIMYQLSLYGVCFLFFVMMRGEQDPLMHLKPFQKEFACLWSIPAEQIHSASEFQQRCSTTTGPVADLLRRTDVDRSNPIAILTAREFD
jgi:hypothetical protein